jgi:hypothetical protein
MRLFGDLALQLDVAMVSCHLEQPLQVNNYVLSLSLEM